jgi:branched-chain amino acid transport system ATP-binding protein
MSLLIVERISKAFGGVRAVDEVSFEVRAGEMLALIGPNGAGKSTLFNLINGQLRADGGSVRLLGTELLGQSARGIWRLGVGRTFQVAQTFASLTVLENVQMALLSHERKVFHFWTPASTQYRARALALLDLVGMANQSDRPCHALAYGDVKRVELALALSHDPTLLLMDEPTAGMAPQERRDLMRLTRQLANQRNLAVLFTEHSMDVVFAHADRVLVLSRGGLIAQGLPEVVRLDPRVQEVYFGTGIVSGLSLAACAESIHPRVEQV